MAGLLRFTLKKADRILKRSEFITLSRHGRKLQNDVFIAFVLPGRSDRSRLGITVTRKVGGAVKRNRIKRLVREFFRREPYRHNGIWDINIIARKRAAELPSKLIFRALKSIFDQLEGCLEQGKR